MKVGLFGFGRAGKAVATVLLQSNEANLCWVIRKSTILQHRSVPEFLGIESKENGFIFPKDEWPPGKLFEEHPVDVIIDFSSQEAILRGYKFSISQFEHILCFHVILYPTITWLFSVRFHAPEAGQLCLPLDTVEPLWL